MEKIGTAIDITKYQKTAKKGGVQDPLTELRVKTAALIGKPFLQVCGLTRGFTAQRLEILLKEVDEIAELLAQHGKVGNKGAIFWGLFKKAKLYGKNNKQILRPDRKKGRITNKEKRPTLF